MNIDNIQAQETLNELPRVKMDVDQAAVLLESAGNKKLEDVLKTDKLVTDDSNIGLSEETTELDPEKLEELVEAFNNFMMAFDQKFKFRVYEDTNQVWVRIMDMESDKVLREIPARETLQLAAKIKEFVGLLVDKFA